jgi:hypothetical protein
MGRFRRKPVNDLQSLAQSLNYIQVRDADTLPKVQHKWQYAPELSEFIDRFNFAIEDANFYADRPENRYETLSNETRVKLFAFAALWLAFSLAGSVGEAAFQLRQAWDARRAGTP